MEGVMMKNKDEYAVAVRKPNNEIVVEKSTHKDISDKIKLFKLPIFRGILAFVDSLVIGMKALNFSTNFIEEEEETSDRKKKSNTDQKKNSKAKNESVDFEIEEVSAAHTEIENAVQEQGEEAAAKEAGNDQKKKAEKTENKSNALMMVFAVIISIAISITLFMVLPVLLTSLLSNFTDNQYLMNLVEAVVRLGIFIGYVLLASRMPEIKRVFMYHGAEHKTINCLENGFELTVENVKWQSKEHKRCGTSFMLLVVLISAVFFMFLPTDTVLERVLSRVLLVPIIAGISYEFIRLAGKSESKIVNIISRPGLWMQGLTTKEPDDTMIEVAIESVAAVFDWRAFLETSASKEGTKAKTTAQKKQAASSTAKAGDKKQGSKEKQASPSKQESQASQVKLSTSTPSKAAASTGTTSKATSSKAAPSKEAPSKTASSKAVPPKAVPPKIAPVDEEDDEILKALDKFFDDANKESGKSE